MPKDSDSLSIEVAAVRLLGMREHSERELRDKLGSRFADSDLIVQIIADLQRRNLQSDERFTEHYVSSRTRKGYGPLRICAELEERGIGSDLIDAWVEVSGSEWRKRLGEVARQKFGGEAAQDQKEQARRARFLQYRGFPSALIRSYLWD